MDLCVGVDVGAVLNVDVGVDLEVGVDVWCGCVCGYSESPCG